MPDPFCPSDYHQKVPEACGKVLGLRSLLWVTLFGWAYTHEGWVTLGVSLGNSIFSLFPSLHIIILLKILHSKSWLSSYRTDDKPFRVCKLGGLGVLLSLPDSRPVWHERPRKDSVTWSHNEGPVMSCCVSNQERHLYLSVSLFIQLK